MILTYVHGKKYKQTKKPALLCHLIKIFKKPYLVQTEDCSCSKKLHVITSVPCGPYSGFRVCFCFFKTRLIVRWLWFVVLSSRPLPSACWILRAAWCPCNKAWERLLPGRGGAGGGGGFSGTAASGFWPEPVGGDLLRCTQQ